MKVAGKKTIEKVQKHLASIGVRAKENAHNSQYGVTKAQAIDWLNTHCTPSHGYEYTKDVPADSAVIVAALGGKVHNGYIAPIGVKTFNNGHCWEVPSNLQYIFE
jgi:hypothetical protein